MHSAVSYWIVRRYLGKDRSAAHGRGSRWAGLCLLLAIVLSPAAQAQSFKHPGLLNTDADFQRIRTQLAEGRQPWLSGWNVLLGNRHSALDWIPHPATVIYRGNDGTHKENYNQLFNDTAAAYALAVRWKISGDPHYADKAVEIMNAWSSTLTAIGGTSDAALAAGIYGYQFANAGELMRDYAGWDQQDFQRFKRMLLEVFYPISHNFLIHHNNQQADHYWANWDLAQLNAILAIGVLSDNRTLYEEAITYFKQGSGNGNISKAIWKLYPDQGMGQVQESGRDQGHATLVIALLANLCQMAWNQGDDVFGDDDNRVLKGAEYVAAYNLGKDVPYTVYRNSDVTQPVISAIGRGTLRPTWELLYNHYVVRQKLEAPNVSAFAAKMRPEGGGGDGNPNSGGFDQLGYGTLLYTLPVTGQSD